VAGLVLKDLEGKNLDAPPWGFAILTVPMSPMSVLTTYNFTVAGRLETFCSNKTVILAINFGNYSGAPGSFNWSIGSAPGYNDFGAATTTWSAASQAPTLVMLGLVGTPFNPLIYSSVGLTFGIQVTPTSGATTNTVEVTPVGYLI
jgi:hypothetical protein